LRIIIDIDDTLGDLLTPSLDDYFRDYHHRLTRDDITEWDITNFVVPECNEKFFDYFKNPEIYDRVEPIMGAQWGVEELRKRGHELLFVTAAVHPGKGPWLIKWGFVEESWDIPEYACIRNKSLIQADIIIDDRPDTVDSFPGYGILFDRPHNRHYEPSDSKSRAISWEDIIGLVDFIELEMSNKPDFIDPNFIWNLGVGPDAPTVVNEKGGKQAEIRYAPSLADPLVMLNLFGILYKGSIDYGKWNWRRIELTDQLDHAFTHMYAWLAGDRSDDHLGHAFCRLMFAKSLELTPGESERMKPE
jgi:5'(3')-deoxyribonucleotidase